MLRSDYGSDNLKLSSESPVLKGGEERVEFSQGGTVDGLEFFDGCDSAGKFLLQLDWGDFDECSLQPRF